MHVKTVGDLRDMLKDLPDNMPVEDMDCRTAIMFVNNFEDVDGDKPPPTLIIDFG